MAVISLQDTFYIYYLFWLLCPLCEIGFIDFVLKLGKLGSERLNDLPKVIQLINHWAGSQAGQILKYPSYRWEKVLQKHLPEAMGIVVSEGRSKKQPFPLGCFSLLVSVVPKKKKKTYHIWVCEALWRQISDTHCLCHRGHVVAQLCWCPAFSLCFFLRFPSAIACAARTGGLMVERSPGHMPPLWLCCPHHPSHGPHRLYSDLFLRSSLPCAFSVISAPDNTKQLILFVFLTINLRERENLMSLVHLFF